MNTNQCFSFSRFVLLMKRDWLENWKTNLYRLIGPYAAILFVMWVLLTNGADFQSFAGFIAIVFAVLLYWGSLWSASHILESMNTQQKRISFLMLPATSFEKFLSRFLYVTVGFVLMCTLSLLLAEATRFLIQPFFDLPDTFNQSVLSTVWREGIHEGITLSERFSYEDFVVKGSIHFLYLVWIHSFFLLAGCCWYKHAFWKTLGLTIVVWLLIITVIVNSIHEVMLSDILEFISKSAFNFIAILVYSLLILLNWWLSYRCFTRQQVIEPKFRLL